MKNVSDEEQHPKLKLIGIILIAVCVASVASYVVATLVLNFESSPVNIEVQANGSVTLTTNATTGKVIRGDILQLTAMLSGQGFNVANQTVNFYQNGVLNGTASTNGTGVSVLNLSMQNTGNFTFKANCTVTVP